MDGEAIQIEYVTTEAGVEAYRAMNALALKPPASTTHITQALDRGFLFPWMKRLVKGNANDDLTYAGLHGFILEVFDQHDASITGAKFDKRKKHRLALGCIRIYAVAKEKMNFNVMVRSFQDVGLLDKINTVSNPMVVMNMFGVDEKLSIVEQTSLISDVEGLVPKFVRQGHLTDSDLQDTNAFRKYVKLGFNDNSTVHKDQLTI